MVLIVLLSHDSRTILLERRPDEPAWWPLRIQTPSHRSYVTVVHRWQRHWSKRSGIRRGSVTGRMASGAGATRWDWHVVILKLTGEVDADWFSPFARWCSISRWDWHVVILKLTGEVDADWFSPFARWCSISEIGSIDVFPLELGVLMTGYVEGWIPDGPITLDV
ncbi:hypothetical protein OG609_06895 [Streptomyces sp. NBC_01224]|uniref:hypothetical protein n=1 Tax=Streptomyces sp. NBC_01224 TaxID=2903783 RepID=UPI002E127327|nr:hypothetical protein OG609_06895 [Streptomyces sp. NBC_01224]